MERHSNHYRSGGRNESRRGPPRYTRQPDTDSTEEEEEGKELIELGQRPTNDSLFPMREQQREQLVFDKDTGRLVVKEEQPRTLASKTVLTGIASSGFF